MDSLMKNPLFWCLNKLFFDTRCTKEAAPNLLVLTEPKSPFLGFPRSRLHDPELFPHHSPWNRED